MTGREIAIAEMTAAAASLKEALPPSLQPLFDAVFLRSWDLYDEFVYRLTLRVFESAGLEAATREPGSTSEVAARAGFKPEPATIPLDWILRQLAARQILEPVHGAEGIRWRRSPGPLPALAPDPIRDEQAALDASWLPAYTLAETVARDYVRFLRGEITGEEVLFSPARLRLWIDYFSNANGLYAVNNRVGAIAAAEWLPHAAASILELGGGLGSAASRAPGGARGQGPSGRARRVPLHGARAGIPAARSAGAPGAVPRPARAHVRDPGHEPSVRAARRARPAAGPSSTP